MEKDHPNHATSTMLGQFGLLVLVGGATLFTMFLALLVPPWFRVEATRRQTLYWSEITAVHNRDFVGIDFVFAAEKWRRLGPRSVSSEALFSVVEYHIAWPILAGEWFLLALVGTWIYFRWLKRLHLTNHR
jgi:hypothetical protein